MIFKDGIQADLSKVEVVKMWPRPSSVTEIQSFQGLAGYYIRFFQEFSRLAAPLTRLPRKGVKYQWEDKCEERFRQLEERLVFAPFLILLSGPKGFTVYCDASRVGLG